MVAPTGARLGKTDHSAVPITTPEVVATAMACADAGATVIHAHVRDDQGKHSIDADRYNELAAAIAARTDIRIQVSTEAAGVFEVAHQQACLENVNVRDVSVSVREAMRVPDNVVDFYAIAQRRGMSIQHILYDAEDLGLLLSLQEQGKIPIALNRVIFVLGRYAADMQSIPGDLDPFLKRLGQKNLTWSVCAFGREEHNCLLYALENGGHARIGFENSTTAPDGSIHADNAASVARFVDAAGKRGFAPKGTME